MKKSLKNGLLGIVLLTTIVANASELNNVKISEVKKLDISLSSVLKGEVLSIMDKQGEIIYSEILSKADEFLISIDFSKFDQGVYYMKSVVGLEIKVTPLIIAPQQLKVIQGETKTYNTPVFTIKDDMLNVLVKNKDKRPIKIIIYAGSHEIDVTKNNVASLISKNYDLSYLTSGNYIVSVIDGDHISSKEINL